MSNPAVIILDEVKSKKRKNNRFVIEDNIGESIHVHIDSMRVDFTINEFVQFSKLIRKSLKQIDTLRGYDIDTFDEYFLKEISDYLPNLIEIKKEKIRLKNLYVISHYNYREIKLQKIISLNKASAYKYLKKYDSNFIDYRQTNYYGISNEERLNSLLNSIMLNGYPFNENYIIMFNGQNLIRDGQHRAIILAYLHGMDYEVEILRFYIKGKSHNMRVNKNNMKKIILGCKKIFNEKLKNYFNK